MTSSTTDGAPSSAVVESPASSPSAPQDPWDTVFADAKASVPERTLTELDAPHTPETASPTPVAAPAPASGDGGTGTAAPESPASKDEAAAPPTPTTPPPAPSDAPADPMAGTEPVTFVVDGAVQTIDGLIRIPGQGIVVPEAHVPTVQRLFAQAVSMERSYRDATTAHRTLDEATAWKTRNAEGAEETLTGVAALEARDTTLGTLTAAFGVLASVFQSDPTTLLSQDADGKIVWNPDALERLKLRSDVAERDARDSVRTRYAGLNRPAPTARPTTADTPAAPDWASVGPSIIRQTAQNMGVDLKPLTTEDRTFVASMLPRFARPATTADQQLNPSLKLGELVIDPAFGDLLKDRVTVRADAAKAVQSAEKVGKFNAGVDKGRPAPAKPAPAPAVPHSPSGRPAKVSADELWGQLVTDAQTVVTGR